MTLNPNIHNNILHKILVDIYSNTSIAPFLGFKGGKAAATGCGARIPIVMELLDLFVVLILQKQLLQ